jgi:hypothetical protein
MNSIIKKYDRITVIIQGELQRKFYIHDVYAIVFVDVNAFSLFAKDTDEWLYDHLSAVDFNSPTGTALQIIDGLGIEYVVQNSNSGTIRDYLHVQTLDSDVWNVVHPLNKLYNHVTVILSDNKTILTDVEFLTPTTLKITFSEPQRGHAYIS